MKKKTLLLVSGWLLGTASLVCADPLKQVKVTQYDTVYSIAYNNGITTHALIAANNLAAPYVLTLGQTLVIPSPNQHVVGRGENLQDIAHRHGVNVDILAQENNISGPDVVKQGNILVIPSRDTEPHADVRAAQPVEIATSSLAPLPLVKVAPQSKNGQANMSGGVLPGDLADELRREKEAIDRAPSESETADEPHPKKKMNFVKEEPTAQKKEESKKEKKKKEKDSENKNEKKKAEPKDTEKAASFAWPAEGTVISEFGVNGNEGINIELPVGSSVKASSGGKVLYAGSELKNLGQLLLIEHKGGWVTAYAHLSELQVGKGDKVKKGQVIALSGKTGDAKQPQLHFEIRKGKKPIDPLGKLGG